MDAIIVEEMWSSKKILVDKGYCPIQIIPLRTYLAEILGNGLRPNYLSGITPAIATIALILFVLSIQEKVGKSINSRFKQSKLVSGMLEFLLGISMLSMILAPTGRHNPSISLHTLIKARKQSNFQGSKVIEGDTNR